MTHEDKLILNYLSLLNHLRSDLKLRLATALLESLQQELKPVEKKDEDSWLDLFGVWADTDDDLHLKIREGRLSNRDVPSFDDL